MSRTVVSVSSTVAWSFQTTCQKKVGYWHLVDQPTELASEAAFEVLLYAYSASKILFTVKINPIYSDSVLSFKVCYCLRSTWTWDVGLVHDPAVGIKIEIWDRYSGPFLPHQNKKTFDPFLICRFGSTELKATSLPLKKAYITLSNITSWKARATPFIT